MKLDEAILHGSYLPHVVYNRDTYKYLSLDGRSANAMGFAALGIGFSPREFRRHLNKGMEDAFVYTLRSEIWFAFHPIWPWLTNDDYAQIALAEQTGGLDGVLDWVRLHQPKVDDQQPIPVLRPVVYPEAPLSQPVVEFSQEQIQFIGHCLASTYNWDDPVHSHVVETMASEFEKHVPKFNPADFYNAAEKETK